MTSQSALFEVVVGFAHAATGSFTIDGVLRDLAAAAGRVLPVAGAGVAYLDDGRMRFVSASSDPVTEVEKAQERLAQGPCHEVARDGESVVVADIAAEAGRWPDFSPYALDRGLLSVASIPLRARNVVWGALDLYSAAAGPWDEADLRAAGTLADVAVSYVVMASDRDAAV